MPEFRCEDCGKRLFHENETTLEVEKTDTLFAPSLTPNSIIDIHPYFLLSHSYSDFAL